MVDIQSHIGAYRQAFQQRMQHMLEAREELRQRALCAVQDRALAVLTACSSVRRAYLFGSIIRQGAFGPDSDIDIALEGTTAADYFAVWRDLERALPEWAVDVREIADSSPFADLIHEIGMLIYERADSTTPDRDSG
jgi:predicted nucleotidyltransferase